MQFFITSTGTNVGKTFVLNTITKNLILDNQKVLSIKPIISGFNIEDKQNDCSLILKTFNQEINQENLDKISLYRLVAPLSPNLAARLENKNIDFLKLTKFCQEKINEAKFNKSYLLIEGAGGVMTPINDNKTFADLISTLSIPTILVIGNYLGTISHTLTAIKAMQAHQINIKGIILNCRADDKIDRTETLKTIQEFTNIKVSTQISLNF